MNAQDLSLKYFYLSFRAAEIVSITANMNLTSGSVFGNPIPNEFEGNGSLYEGMIEQAVKEQERLEAEDLSGREDLILNPATHFDERFEAVMVDILQGRHASQIHPNMPGLFDQPEEHETDDDNPTSDF